MEIKNRTLSNFADAISPNKQPILPLFFSQPHKKHNSINFLNLRIIFAHMKILKKEYK